MKKQTTGLKSRSIIYTVIAFSIRHAVPVICGFLLLSALFVYFALKIKMSPDVETLLPKGEKVEELMRQLGGGEPVGEFLVVAVRGQELFTIGTLTAFGEMLDRIKAFEEIQQGITPFDMVVIGRTGKQIRMLPLAPGSTAPRTEEELRLFEDRIRNSPFARNLVISADATVLVAIFTCAKTLDYARLMDKIRSVTADYQGRLDIIISGSVPFLERTGIYLARDLSKLLGIAALIILLSYYLGFRAVRGVVLPFIVVALGTVWCLGFMALVGFSLTIVTVVIPPLVLILGSSYSIHVLNQYYREAGVEPRNKIWIADSVFHVTWTVLLAAATTIAGLLSLFSVSLVQIWQFAVATSFGIIACALLSMTLLPAALSLLKHPSPRQTEQVLTGLLSRLMEKVAGWALRFKLPILAVVAVLAVAFAFTVKRLEFTTDTISYFPRHDPVVADMLFLTGKIGGFDEINLTLLAPNAQSNYFLQTDILDQVSRLEKDLRSNPDIGYVASFVTYRDYVDSLFGRESDATQSRVPLLLLARMFRSLSGNEDIARYLRIMANQDFSRLTLSMRIFNSRTGKFIDERGLRRILGELELSAKTSLDGQIEWVVWGTSLRFLAVADMIRKDLVASILLTLVATGLISCAAFRSFRYGLFTLAPLLVGLMVNFVLMVLFAIPLDATTFMVSSVTIGVGVDNAIHFLLQYRRLRSYSDNIIQVLIDTLRTTGRPIFITTAAIVCGLLVLVLASFKPIVYFGVLVILTLSSTSLATLFVMPAILAFLNRRRKDQVR